MARREKKPVHKVVMTEGKRNIICKRFSVYAYEYYVAAEPPVRCGESH